MTNLISKNIARTVTPIVSGSDNVVAIVLYEDGSPKGMSAVTRVQIHVDDADSTVIDSGGSSPVTMDWTEAVTFNNETTYPIQFEGDDSGLAAGVYRDCRVRLFDGDNPEGVVWPDPLTLVVE